MVEKEINRIYCPKNYHEIRLCLLDIYQDGEDEAFIKLSSKSDNPNLIIFPSNYRDALSPIRKKEDLESVPGTGALNLLNQKPIVSRTPNYAIFRINSGLDVAIVKDNEVLLPSKLETISKEFFGKPATVLTNDEGYFNYYLTEGVPVENTRDFILANPEIVKKGMIPATSKFASKINSPEFSKGMPLEIAIDLMDQELFINQFIEILGSPNQYVQITGEFKWNRARTEISEVKDPVAKLYKVPNSMSFHMGNFYFNNLFGFKPAGIDQYFAIQEGILNPNVETCFISGELGSGKTFLTYFASLALVSRYPKDIREKIGLSLEEKEGLYDGIAVFRPNNPVGGKDRDEGTLPGDLWKKTHQQFGGFISAHEKRFDFPFEEMIRHPKIEMSECPKRKVDRIGDFYLPPNNPALSFYSFADIRGRSFENMVVIIDEAQNYTKRELEALITRLSHNSKLIILGDPYQIDNPRCSEKRNGLVSAIRHYLRYENTALFYLTENRRSPTSRRAKSWKS